MAVMTSYDMGLTNDMNHFPEQLSGQIVVQRSSLLPTMVDLVKR